MACEMTFFRINNMLGGKLKETIDYFEKLARFEGFDKAYTLGKRAICRYVGWNSDSEMLNNNVAYDLIIDELSEACWRGEEFYETAKGRNWEIRAETFLSEKDFLALNKCETPIEKIMYAELVMQIKRNNTNKVKYVIEPQKRIQVGRSLYRVDFMVKAKSPDGTDKERTVVFIIECDGHQFHEKSEEQASRDKKRDRALKIAGYDTLRFTGSEIWNEPESCAFEVFSFVNTALLKTAQEG
jgi:very-short-patch-repair endonuclease